MRTIRFLVEVRIPTDLGNAALKNGTMTEQIQKYLNDVKPEAAYFAVANGQRTVYLVLDLENTGSLAEIVEPLWLDWRAEIYFSPVMTVEDFEKAGPVLQKILEARKKHQD